MMSIPPLFEPVLDLLTMPLRFFLNGSERTNLTFLLSAGLIALILYTVKNIQNISLQGLGQHFFPRKVWAHPSAIRDYHYFWVYAFVQILILVPLVSIISPNASRWAGELCGLFYTEGLWGAPGTVGIVLMTIAMVLAFDVAIFIMHWLHHKIPGLWEFHKGASFG